MRAFWIRETHARRVDVRLIAATHRDLWREVEQGTFREDLFYRLRVVDLHVPPLRERPDELQTLAGEFLERTVARLERPIQGYTSAALDRLLAYLWPGNIRELEHAIERACAVAVASARRFGDGGPSAYIVDVPGGRLTVTYRALLAHATVPVLVDEQHRGAALARRERAHGFDPQ